MVMAKIPEVKGPGVIAAADIAVGCPVLNTSSGAILENTGGSPCKVITKARGKDGTLFEAAD